MAVEVVGRDRELAAIVEFLGRGPSSVAALLLEGEAGVGKTTLWLNAIELARDQFSYRVLVSRPAEAEAKISFAALRDLLSDVLDDVRDELPGPQRHALEVALLIAEEDRPPDRRAIAFGLLNALRAVARDRRVLLCVDDVQWLDEPSREAIAFAARRLRGEPILLMLSARVDRVEGAPAWIGTVTGVERVERLEIGPLSLGALAQVLRAELGVVLPRPALHRLYDASGGNPFYAIEIGRALERHGGQLDPTDPLPIPSDLDRLVRDRLASLSRGAREALLAAAALSEPTVQFVERAVGSDRDLQEALDARVIEIDRGRVRFVNPVLGAAISAQATPAQLRTLHRRLADVVPGSEERALHLALGTEGTDSDVADELGAAARDARLRGAPSSSAALLEHALRLAPADHAAHVRWEIDAAEAHFEAGDPQRATTRLARLAESLPSGEPRAEVLWRLAAISGELEPARETVRLYEEALQEVGKNVALAVRIHSELAWMVIFIHDLPSALVHARRAVELADQIRDPGVVAEALASLVYVELVAGLPIQQDMLETALELERRSDRVRIDRSPSAVRGFQLTCVGDFAAARSYFEELGRVALERGDESNASISGYYLAVVETLAGNWIRAAAHVRGAAELSEQTGVNQSEVTYSRALLDAHLGQVEAAVLTAQQNVAEADRAGHPLLAIRNLSVLGFVDLSRGDFQGAHGSLARAAELSVALGLGEPALLRFVPDGVEVLVALQRTVEAQGLLELFEGPARRLGRSWAIAIADRCRGLILAAEGDLREALTALERARTEHERSSMPFDRARTLLALGVAQRRAKQRRAARESLEGALDIFAGLGARLWAQNARNELARIGGRAKDGDELTPSERRIAELVAGGCTNREVAAELFVTVHTVEAALTRAYRKLGIRSRTQLAGRLSKL